MASTGSSAGIDAPIYIEASLWVARTTLLWKHRRMLATATAIALLASIAIAFLLPKRYESVTRIMPPDQQGANAMVLAALASRAGGLGSLASGFLSGRISNSALFIDLLRSGTVAGHLIDRFQLQALYGSRYRMDAAKKLARRTTIVDDKKSGVITISVQDGDPVRARDMAQTYLDELNKLVTQTNTSAARQERIFIEGRLQSVQADLETSQAALSDFSSKNSTVDIKEQARASMDAAAKVQGEMLVEQASLNSLRQIYGDGNVRVREAQVRISTLQNELNKMTGTAAPLAIGKADEADVEAGEISPALRQLPRLAVPFADLYRRVRVQEAVYELLTQQFEMARIEEAKDIPVVSVIDPPGIPEKKVFPPRMLIVLMLTTFAFAGTSIWLLLRDRWATVENMDPRKLLLEEIVSTIFRPLSAFMRTKGGAA